MNKLTNASFLLSHEFLKQEFGEYLATNGYRYHEEGKSIVFSNASMRIYVRGNNIDVFKHDPLHDPEQPWQYVSSFTGFADMNFFQWMHLMQAMGLVHIKQHLDNAKAKGQQEFVETASTLKSMFAYLKPTLS